MPVERRSGPAMPAAGYRFRDAVKSRNLIIVVIAIVTAKVALFLQPLPTRYRRPAPAAVPTCSQPVTNPIIDHFMTFILSSSTTYPIDSPGRQCLRKMAYKLPNEIENEVSY
jgi:hypothetical protein